MALGMHPAIPYPRRSRVAPLLEAPDENESQTLHCTADTRGRQQIVLYVALADDFRLDSSRTALA